nr:hypothetical protein [Escherichia coli]
MAGNLEEVSGVAEPC